MTDYHENSHDGRIVTLVGGGGFIGRYAVRALARRGYRLRVICRHPEAAMELKTCGDLGQILVTSGNLARPETIIPQLAGSDAVINLVGVLSERKRQKFSALHAQGAERLAQAAKLAGIPTFIHVSALGVDKAITSAYARSKALGEQAVRAAFPEAVILRPGVVFGPEDRFLNPFAALASVFRVLPLIGGGKTLFQPVYVGDVAEAIAACVDNPAAAGKIFELGGPEVLSFKQLLTFVMETVGRKPRFIPMPFAIAGMKAAFLELAPRPLLTRDSVRLLHYDNVVDASALTLASLGIEPHALRAVAPDYLARYRKSVVPQALAGYA